MKSSSRIRDLFDVTDDMLVIGEAATGAEAIKQIPAAGADVVVLDVRLDDLDGITVWKALHALCPSLRCMFLTAYTDDDVMLAARWPARRGTWSRKCAAASWWSRSG